MYIKNNAFENQIFDHFRKTQKTIDNAVKLLKDNNYKVIDPKGNEVN
jgi:hypothetical protein